MLGNVREWVDQIGWLTTITAPLAEVSGGSEGSAGWGCGGGGGGGAWRPAAGGGYGRGGGRGGGAGGRRR